jgi:DNA polymerase III epsilon subunit-like protein
MNKSDFKGVHLVRDAERLPNWLHSALTKGDVSVLTRGGSFAGFDVCLPNGNYEIAYLGDYVLRHSSGDLHVLNAGEAAALFGGQGELDMLERELTAKALAKPTFLVLDTEATGLSIDCCGPIEVAARLLTRDLKKVGGDFHALISPEGLVWEKVAFKMNHDWVDWDAPALPLVRAQLLSWLSDSGAKLSNIVVCGSNPKFDVDMMQLRGQFSHRTIDTSSLMLGPYIDGVVSSTGLKAARKVAGCSGEQAHRALSDVIDVHTVLMWSYRKYGGFHV